MLPVKLKYERQNEKSESPLFGIFLFVLLLGLSCSGIGIAYFSLSNEIPALYQSVLSRVWTKTEGKITKTYSASKRISSGSVKNPGSALVFVPTVEYSFQAASGETLTGNRINFSAAEKYFTSEEESQNYLNSTFPVNKTVEVFYNPNQPQQESALSREYVYNSSSYQTGCGCGSLAIFFSFLTWLSLRDLIKYFRQRKKRER